mmetsp:Transcript_47132/g.102555  ORF Transcript_47132/g.102555 Transcript_47132/m.102555 type:complete len:228 (+) Transcript_47132:67-750(+)
MQQTGSLMRDREPRGESYAVQQANIKLMDREVGFHGSDGQCLGALEEKLEQLGLYVCNPDTWGRVSMLRKGTHWVASNETFAGTTFSVEARTPEQIAEKIARLPQKELRVTFGLWYQPAGEPNPYRGNPSALRNHTMDSSGVQAILGDSNDPDTHDRQRPSGRRAIQTQDHMWQATEPSPVYSAVEAGTGWSQSGRKHFDPNAGMGKELNFNSQGGRRYIGTVDHLS